MKKILFILLISSLTKSIFSTVYSEKFRTLQHNIGNATTISELEALKKQLQENFTELNESDINSNQSDIDRKISLFNGNIKIATELNIHSNQIANPIHVCSSMLLNRKNISQNRCDCSKPINRSGMENISTPTKEDCLKICTDKNQTVACFYNKDENKIYAKSIYSNKDWIND